MNVKSMNAPLMARRDGSSNREHAEFCEQNFARDLLWLIRLWKWAGKPVKR